MLKCSACSAPSPKWTGRCGACGEWNTLGTAAKPAKKPPAPRKPIKQVSNKRAKENVEREKIRPEVISRGCEICPKIRKSIGKLPWKCPGRATDLHEVKTRGRGGSITDPDNILAGCRRGHMWVTEHPAESAVLELVKHAWDK